jgi:hypothetical protein
MLHSGVGKKLHQMVDFEILPFDKIISCARLGAIKKRQQGASYDT